MSGRDLIRLKRGNKMDLGELEFGEPAYVIDEESLYIGTMNGTVNLTKGNNDYKELKDLINDHIANHPTSGSGESGSVVSDEEPTNKNLIWFDPIN